MKSIFYLKHLQAILFSIIFLTSFVISQQFTDPFLTPKYFFFFFSSCAFILVSCLIYYNRKYNSTLTFSWIDIIIVSFVLFSFIKILFTSEVSVDNLNFYLLLIHVILYFLIKPLLFESDKKNPDFPINTITNILLIIALIQVIWGFLQYFNIIPNKESLFQIGGAFGNPGQFTNFITPILAFSLAVFLFSRGLNKKLGAISSVGIIAILPFTQARSSWIAAIFVIFYLLEKKFLILKKCNDLLKSPLLKGTIIIILAGIIIVGGLFIYNIKKDSSSGRLFIWEVSSTMIKEKPLWGYGFDRYAAAHNDYQAQYFRTHPNDKENVLIADSVNFAFNEFIQITVETGLIGLIILSSLFCFALCSKQVNPKKQNESMYCYAAKGSILAIFIISLFSYPLHIIPSLTLLFFSLAIISNNNRIIYNIILLPKTRKGIALIGLILIFVFSVVQIKRNKAEHKWLTAYQMMRQNKYADAYKIYQEIYSTLTYSQFFLFNYGAELSLMKKYDESLIVLKKAESRLNDSDFYIFMGNNYENKGMYKDAEQSYLKASYIMPLKFVPKYRLVHIYLKTGRKEEALILAKEMLSMPVKIPSTTIDGIKQEMTELIKNNP